jgi:ubiquinol-cytochrome c reductase iron-sulfur subunit
VKDDSADVDPPSNELPTDADQHIRATDAALPRRDFIHIMGASVAVVGSGGALWPLIDSFNPSADVRATSSVEVDLEPFELGQRITVKWRGKPVFISRRTAREIELARADDHAKLRDPQTDAERVIDPEWLVVIGICTHLGCVPLGQAPQSDRGGWNGWFCPCHGSHYDTSGRIRRGPAPLNLEIPPYEFLDPMRLKIG